MMESSMLSQCGVTVMPPYLWWELSVHVYVEFMMWYGKFNLMKIFNQYGDLSEAIHIWLQFNLYISILIIATTELSCNIKDTSFICFNYECQICLIFYMLQEIMSIPFEHIMYC